MRRTLSLLAIVGIIAGGCTTATRISVLEMPISTETHVAPIDVAPYLEKYAGYDGVFLDYEYTVEHSGNKSNGLGNRWIYSYIFKTRKMIINPEAAWLTTIELPAVKPDKLYMRVIDPEGNVKYYGVEDLVEFRDSRGYKSYRFVYPNIQRGTVIEYGYDYTFSTGGYPPPLEEDFNLQFSIPCEQADVKYMYPNWWTVAIKQIGKGRSVPVSYSEDTLSKKTIIAYHGTNIPAVKPEPFGPYFKDMAMYLTLQVTSFKMLGIDWDAPATWDDLVGNFRKYAIKKSEKGSDKVQRLVDSLTATCKTPYEKMDAINDYLVTTIKRERVDYDGNSGKIIDNKQGNSYEITSLAEQMLAKADISSQYLLVHDASDGYFDPTYYDAYQVNMPALRVPIDSTDYVLFPYIERLPVNVIPGLAQGQPAIIASEWARASTWTVPTVPREENREDRTCDVVVDTSGTVRVTETRVLRGSGAWSMRNRIQDYTPAELRDTLKELVSYQGMNITLDTFTVEHEKDYKEPLTITLQYSMDNTLAFAGDDAILQTAGLLAPVSYLPQYTDSTERTNPISIEYDRLLHRELSISYPDAWNIITPLQDVSYENQFGAVKGTYLAQPGKLTVEQDLSLNRSDGTKEQIGELVSLIGTTPKTWVPSIVFRRAVAN